VIEQGSQWVRITDNAQFIDEIITVTAVTTARLDRSMVFVQYAIEGKQAGTFTGKESTWRRSFRPTQTV
jgi:hypothetical protein